MSNKTINHLSKKVETLSLFQNVNNENSIMQDRELLKEENLTRASSVKIVKRAKHNRGSINV